MYGTYTTLPAEHAVHISLSFNNDYQQLSSDPDSLGAFLLDVCTAIAKSLNLFDPTVGNISCAYTIRN
jgi:hypothetical protein